MRLEQLSAALPPDYFVQHVGDQKSIRNRWQVESTAVKGILSYLRTILYNMSGIRKVFEIDGKLKVRL